MSIVALIISLLLLFGGPLQANSTSDSHSYISQKGEFSIVIPKKWDIEKQEGDTNVDVIALAPNGDPNDLFRENMNVFVSKIDVPMSKDEYYDFNLKALQNLLEDFDLEESRNVTLGNEPARELVFSHTMGIVNAHVVQYLIMEENKVYVLTFSADPIDFKNYQPIFEDIAKSFKVMRTTANARPS